MTARDRDELRIEIRKAVAEAMGNHKQYCRFTDEEAARLHQVPQDLDRDALFTLSRMVRSFDSAWSWVGRVLLFALIALMAWGLAKLCPAFEIGP